jgi:hypothetical protein
VDIRRTKFWPKTKEANETLFSENEEQTTSSNNGQNCCHGHAFFPPYQYPLFWYKHYYLLQLEASWLLLLH